MAQKQPAPQGYTKPDHIQISGSKVYSILRQKWVALTPEERVRQEFLFVLINEYGYSLDQIDEETPVTIYIYSSHWIARFVLLTWLQSDRLR